MISDPDPLPQGGRQVRSVGLVLGSGGVLGGAWEVGALHALKQEAGWDPGQADYLVGTSVGSLMAALLAASILPQLDLIAAAAHHPEAFPWPIPGSWNLGLSGMKQRGPRKETVRQRILDGWPVGGRLWIVACDYRTGKHVVFGRAGAPAADLPAAVAASCAIPGVYRPVEIDGRLYADGGLYSAANLDLLIGVGIDLAICLSPLSSPNVVPRPRKLADRLQALAEQAAHRSLIAEADALRASGPPVVLLERGPEDLAAMGLNLMNRKRGPFVFETARRTVAKQLRSAHLRERLGLRNVWPGLSNIAGPKGRRSQGHIGPVPRPRRPDACGMEPGEHS